MSATTIDHSVTDTAATPFSPKNLIKWGALSVVGLSLLYLVWGLYLAGEPLFAVVVLALMVGIVTIFGQAKYYTVRFIFPAIAAIAIFIALPVLYTSYIGFTNFGARNLLSFERVTNQFLGAVSIDKSTERPFKIIAHGDNYQIILPDETASLASNIIPLNGEPASLSMSPSAIPPDEPLAMREVIKLRTPIGSNHPPPAQWQ